MFAESRVCASNGCGTQDNNTAESSQLPARKEDRRSMTTFL
jgi:hypothetical protein